MAFEEDAEASTVEKLDKSAIGGEATWVGHAAMGHAQEHRLLILHVEFSEERRTDVPVDHVAYRAGKIGKRVRGVLDELAGIKVIRPSVASSEMRKRGREVDGLGTVPGEVRGSHGEFGQERVSRGECGRPKNGVGSVEQESVGPGGRVG